MYPLFLEGKEVKVRIGADPIVGSSTIGVDHWYRKFDEFLFTSFDDLADVEVCVETTDACFEVHVVGPTSPDLYEISWGGEIVEAGYFTDSEYVENYAYEPLYSTKYGIRASFTQIGEGCIPSCGDGYALFESKILVIHDYSASHYRVEDSSGSKVLGIDNGGGWNDSASNRYLEYNRLHIHRECLPKDDCYLFINSREKLVQYHDYLNHLYTSVSFDGKEILNTDDFIFNKVYFGQNCSSVCNSQNEVSFELFAAGTSDSRDFSYTWKLMSHNRDGTSELFTSEFVASSTSALLQYDQICVPKDSCLSLSITRSSTLPRIITLVRLDDITYAQTLNGDESIGLGPMGFCSSSAVCEESDDILVDFSYEATEDLLFYGEYPQETSTVPLYSIVLDWEDGDLFMPIFYYIDNDPSGQADFIIPGEKYRKLRCIPDKYECKAHLSIEKEIRNSLSYNVSINGKEIDVSRYKAIDALMAEGYKEYSMLPLGSDCSAASDASTASITNPNIMLTCALAILVGITLMLVV